jgi:hypothetical protein
MEQNMARYCLLAFVVSLSLFPLNYPLAQSNRDPHYEDFINYRTCGNEAYQATWSGNNFRHEKEGGGASHVDSHMQYKSWGNKCFWASWNPATEQFVHAKMVRQGPSHESEIINYETWDGSYWTAIREDDRFYHIFVKEGDPPSMGDLERIALDPRVQSVARQAIVAYLKKKGIPVR